MDASRLKQALSETTCPAAFDRQTRMLYATDASIHRIEPMAVAFPRDAAETRSAIAGGRLSGGRADRAA